MFPSVSPVFFQIGTVTYQHRLRFRWRGFMYEFLPLIRKARTRCDLTGFHLAARSAQVLSLGRLACWRSSRPGARGLSARFHTFSLSRAPRLCPVAVDITMLTRRKLRLEEVYSERLSQKHFQRQLLISAMRFLKLSRFLNPKQLRFRVIYFICKFLDLAKSEKVWLRILFWFTVVGIMAIIVLYVSWRVYVAGVKVTVWNENRLNLKWREQGSYFTMAFDFLIAPVFFTVMIRDHFRIFRSLLMSGGVIPYLLLCVENPYVIVLSIVMIVKIIFVLLVIILVVGLISLLDEGGSGSSGGSGGLIIENIGDGIWAIFEI